MIEWACFSNLCTDSLSCIFTWSSPQLPQPFLLFLVILKAFLEHSFSAFALSTVDMKRMGNPWRHREVDKWLLSIYLLLGYGYLRVRKGQKGAALKWNVCKGQANKQTNKQQKNFSHRSTIFQVESVELFPRVIFSYRVIAEWDEQQQPLNGWICHFRDEIYVWGIS